jgi:hypothetical protein
MGYNRSGARRMAKLKRRRREIDRFVEKCATGNAEAQKKGEPTTDHSREISRKWRTAKLRD